MDEQAIVLYLNRNGWTALVIHDNLVSTLCKEAIAYSTVRKYLREVQTSPGKTTRFSGASHHIDDSDEAILRALHELPFSPGRQLSRATYLRKTTVDRRVPEKLGSLARHL
jgi:hypothetical protein